MKPVVWVAEDDEDFRDLVATVLRTDGFAVEEFDDGRAVVDAARDHPHPAVLVTDHHMADLDGMDALTVLRRDGFESPAVLVSAFVEPSLRRRAENLDATVVPKPVNIANLKKVVRSRLQNVPPSTK